MYGVSHMRSFVVADKEQNNEKGISISSEGKKEARQRGEKESFH